MDSVRVQLCRIVFVLSLALTVAVGEGEGNGNLGRSVGFEILRFEIL